MKVSWQTITVEQFQQIYELTKTADLDEMERSERLICILYRITDHMVNEMPIAQFKRLVNECSFALEVDKIPGSRVKVLKANGKKYGINYSISTMRHRQYVEAIHFGEKPIEHMHLIMASIVQPINFFGKWKRNEADMHKEIATDLLQARLIDVYHSCVFFCKLYLNLINNIQPYLIKGMTETGILEEQAREALTFSTNVSAGCLTQEKWQPLKV